ncbi:MAG: tRNA uridine-5-carboxymethylaminomethyl(34) synthesis GTPase MnmE, partial [Candidatus Zixiibacteriota bacterium]
MITPPGEGGLGAIRISGYISHKILKNIFVPGDSSIDRFKLFHMYFGHIIGRNSEIIDEVTIVLQPEGKSYTGQKQAEIFCHGGRIILEKILNKIYSLGARPAEPGEFTRRAFLNGRIDLAKAEAVADLIASKTEYSYNSARDNLLGKLSEKIDSIRTGSIGLMAEMEASIDYPEEEIEPAQKQALINSLTVIINDIKELVYSYKGGKIIKEGYKIVIAGRPNAGKSSLFNLFLNQDRAIVTPIPGTTRDYLEEWINLEGFPVQISDTAGLREKADRIEKVGQISTRNLIKNSDMIIWIVDISRRSWKKEFVRDAAEFTNEIPILLVLNKIDKVALEKVKESIPPKIFSENMIVYLSCLTKSGYKALLNIIIKKIQSNLPDLTDKLIITSFRHKKKLSNALNSFKKVFKSINRNEPP